MAGQESDHQESTAEATQREALARYVAEFKALGGDVRWADERIVVLGIGRAAVEKQNDRAQAPNDATP